MQPEVGDVIRSGESAYNVIAVLATERRTLYLGVRRGCGFAAALLAPRSNGWQAVPLPHDLSLLEAVGRMLRGHVMRRLLAWDPDFLPVRSDRDLLSARKELR